MFEKAVGVEGAALDQHDRHRAHIHRPDPEADRDDKEVLAEREGPDHPVEGKGRIEHLEIEKRPEPAARRPRRHLGRAVEKPAQHLDQKEGQEPPDRG